MTIKLQANDVQAIRTLGRAGFSCKSIGDAFGVTSRTVWNVLQGRSWSFLPIVDVALPTLPIDTAARLKFRSARKLTSEQRKVLEQYRDRLAAQIEAKAEREAYALSCFREWTYRRPRARGKRGVSATSAKRAA